MACCDYANARIRAMKARLLGPKGITELLAQPGLTTRLDYLKQTDYGEAVAAHLMREPDALRGAERGLRARLVDDLLRIDRFLRGERIRSLFQTVLAFEDGWNLKTVLRGVTQGETPERIFVLLAPTPEFSDPALGELVRQKDVKAVVDLLATWRSPFAPPLTQAFARYRTDRDLFLMEVALDQFLFARALEAARGNGEDGRILRGFLTTQIDLANAGTLLKRADGGRCDDLFIAGGRDITLKRFQQLALLRERDLRETLARGGRLHLDPRLAAMDERADPFDVDQILHQALREAMHREARVHPLSLAVPLSFILERRAEVQRIRLVLRGAEFGLPADELVARVEC
jgi:V/A-type H+/Na+-transporting ATPase subunit C